MNLLRYCLSIILIPIACSSIFGQWQKVNNGITGGTIYDLKVDNGLIFATSKNGLYISSDSAKTWKRNSSLDHLRITTFLEINFKGDTIYLTGIA
ncbi:MAG: hypothetical protein OEW75_00065 [Cyclobacteriaceae bacterium]|nr:hypothetical protein [Cyclobacteriaceae bacterium]